MVRRVFLASLVVCSAICVAPVAFAGSYLNRAALLLDTSRAERDMVRPRSRDRELVRLVHGIARARAQHARDMDVPKAVGDAHPHLLLVLENCERAYAAALEGSFEKFVEHIVRARAEDHTYRAIIAKLGYTLPRTATRP